MFHILVVDDDKNIRMLYRAVFEAANYTVFTAEDGEAALRLLDQHHIDLVVLDIMMPCMDGYELTRTLREADNNLPILMVSAKQMPADKHRGFLLGTDDYMTKPVDHEEMLRDERMKKHRTKRKEREEAKEKNPEEAKPQRTVEEMVNEYVRGIENPWKEWKNEEFCEKDIIIFGQLEKK